MEALGWFTHAATGALGIALVMNDTTLERGIGAFTLLATAFAIATHFMLP